MLLLGATNNICKRCIEKLKKIRNQSYLINTRQKWSSKDVRKTFLDYFCERNGHQFVKSSSIIPPKDAGTYFTNAGMNQFKPIFQGTVVKGSEMSSYTKVANSQKCIRVGGKHNDLNDVGGDLTHHTFFEMLGNWSFGDYGKEEACRLALALLTQVYKIPLERLYFTYHEGDVNLGVKPDLETRFIWRNLGVPKNRIIPFGSKDNFWDMGEVGPCGPCTEIHYDHVGGAEAGFKVNADSPDMVEIWNLVFIQYERKNNGNLMSLPKMHVDTGIGFERMCAVMNGTKSNYDTDLFSPLMHSIHKLTGAPVYCGRVGSTPEAMVDRAYRIISDHIRMATVCISDGLLPGKNQQEDKLRQVIYRALYQCHEVLKAKEGLIGQLTDTVVESLGDVYPEIARKNKLVKEVLLSSEQKYLQIRTDGQRNFDKLLSKHPDIQELNDEFLKRLHDGWYGRPMSLELIEVTADLNGIKINEEDLSQLYNDKKSIVGAPKEVVFPWLTGDIADFLTDNNVKCTEDSPKYQYNKTDNAYVFPDVETTIIHILDKENNVIDSISNGERVGIIVDNTHFYSESGGQRGDKGLISTETGTVLIETTQSGSGYVLHIGRVTEGHIEADQDAILTLDTDFREGCMRNHSSTHLLNSALRQVLGDDVRQRSSDVSDKRLSFDFSSIKSVTNKHVKDIEDIVNSYIKSNIPLKRALQPLTEARYDEKIVSLDNADYPPEVFVVQYDGTDLDCGLNSSELCAGTHVLHTGDIGSFCVTSLTGVAVYGTKAVVCLTGPQADTAILQGKEILQLVTEFEEAVKSETNVEKLQKLIGTLGATEIPKLVRDEVNTRMEAARLNVNILQNKRLYANFQLDLDTIMTNEDELFTVYHMVIKVLPKITKIMKEQTFTKPFILVVDTSNNTSAYVCLPTILHDSREDLVNRFKEAVGGTISLTEDKFDIVKKGGKKHTKLFMDSAEKVLAEYCENFENKVKF